jgi:FkbM family methyltransferase
MSSAGLRLEGRARLTFAAHLFKAIAKQHHRELIPILRPILPPDGIVFDVGAHAGQMAKLFAGMAPMGRVYAFEPGAYALSVLRPAVRLRGRGRIRVEPIALGAEPGRLTLTTPIKRSGSYGFGLSHLGTEGGGRSFRHEVEVDTIDRYVDRHRIARLDLIKADIEGWELRMLQGARRTLATLRPALVLEAVDAYLARAGDTRGDLWRLLRGLGYAPRRLEPGLPIFAPEADGDVVWVPE